MADQIVQLQPDGSGKKVDASELAVGANTVERQRINISDPTTAAAHAGVLNTTPTGTEYGLLTRRIEPSVLFRGRASTFRTPGRAGTAGQKLMSLHNATGSAVTVYVAFLAVDLVQTVIKAVTVLPPVIRCWAVTVLPTNGTALTKNKIGGTTTSNASVTALQDASVDGTTSGSALTATLPAGAIITQEYASRMITAAGYEMTDRLEFFGSSAAGIQLGPLQGIVLSADYVLATQNPSTDMWISTMEWYEV